MWWSTSREDLFVADEAQLAASFAFPPVSQDPSFMEVDKHQLALRAIHDKRAEAHAPLKAMRSELRREPRAHAMLR